MEIVVTILSLHVHNSCSCCSSGQQKMKQDKSTWLTDRRTVSCKRRRLLFKQSIGNNPFIFANPDCTVT
ncbi:hypothetical protein TanjilG_07392 [Lupinus angustifolius]|uniref:Uncharacterized protein n=1 Tax=Lupinus angustifolius TaxID=3871 RepID=A0A4P1R0G7_LUPAN|nr:hypothetical protein TanjilG_07392 [Lupinus angustifolius]